MAVLRKRIKQQLLHLLGYRAPLQLDTSQIGREQWPFVRPVFVLSTGRCGTSWLTELLRQSKHLHVNHTDYPELIRQGRLAFEQHPANLEMFKEIVRACRDGYLAQAYWMGQTYVETNPRICFLAYAVKEVYPSAKFIHLYRHPGDFVRSGLRRGWYEGAAHDEGRIVDHENPDAWRQLNNIEKISWLWNATNQFAEDFLAGLPKECALQIRAESMFSDVGVAQRILDFLGVTDISEAAMQSRLSRPVSAQRRGKPVPPYSEWSEAEKEAVRNYAPLAAKYGYQL